MSQISFTCFYTNPPFWAVEAPDFINNQFPPNFTDVMSAIVEEKTIGTTYIRIAKDGLIEIQNQELEKRIAESRSNNLGSFQESINLWSSYLQILNAVGLVFDMAVLKAQKLALFSFQEITRKDAFRMTYENGQFFSCNVPYESVAGNYSSGRYQSNYRQDLPVFMDSRISTRKLITKETIQLAFEFLDKILNDTEFIDKMNTLSKALSEYKVGNLKTSIVLAWFVIERLLNDKYDQYLDSKDKSFGDKKRISKDRREYLTGRDYTASIISNIMELSDCITFDELKHIDEIRKLRNGVAHHLNKKPITNDDCASALKFTAEFLFQNILVEPELNLSLSIEGI